MQGGVSIAPPGLANDPGRPAPGNNLGFYGALRRDIAFPVGQYTVLYVHFLMRELYPVAQLDHVLTKSSVHSLRLGMPVHLVSRYERKPVFVNYPRMLQ